MNGGGEATASTVLMSILECHVTHPETRVALIVSLSRKREKGRDGGNNIFDARLLHEGDGRRADNQPVQPTTRSFSSSGSLLRRVFPLIGYVSPLSRPPWIPPW